MSERKLSTICAVVERPDLHRGDALGHTLRKKEAHQFSHKDWTQQVTCLVNIALWIWELDVDGGSGEANPSLRKQTLQEYTWHVIQRAYKERIFKATGQHHQRTSRAFTVNRQPSQAIMVRPCLSHDTLPKVTLQEQWMVVVTEEDRVNHWRTTSRNGQASVSLCRHCWVSQMTEVGGQPAQRKHLSEYP